ncbi:predicted protein [Botrytis cinerea T4]|uniref:Uncharacterized protein n=1 Tax=Botryotinia fuckeliana (strain T4) TaxID=999810 RepID=G2YTX6_BOTF4|nr:predicted protein [Botrytis cinerea T4]
MYIAKFIVSNCVILEQMGSDEQSTPTERMSERFAN